jgi:hypothetical protein
LVHAIYTNNKHTAVCNDVLKMPKTSAFRKEYNHKSNAAQAHSSRGRFAGLKFSHQSRILCLVILERAADPWARLGLKLATDPWPRLLLNLASNPWAGLGLELATDPRPGLCLQKAGAAESVLGELVLKDEVVVRGRSHCCFVVLL